MRPPTGVFADFRLVKSRSVAQLIIEVPIEAADHALTALGGLPRPDRSQWVAIAPLSASQPPPKQIAGVETTAGSVKIKRDWPMASQVHMRCQEPTLWTFLQRHPDFVPLWRGARENGLALGEELAAEAVRQWCGVTSRAHIVPGSEAAERWYSLEAEYEQFQRDQAA